MDDFAPFVFIIAVIIIAQLLGRASDNQRDFYSLKSESLKVTELTYDAEEELVEFKLTVKLFGKEHQLTISEDNETGKTLYKLVRAGLRPDFVNVKYTTKRDAPKYAIEEIVLIAFKGHDKQGKFKTLALCEPE